MGTNRHLTSTDLHRSLIIIRYIFSFLFIGRVWSANNSLKITALLQIIFCSCVIELRSCVKMADRFPKQAESDLTYLVDQKNGDRMIKQLLNSAIAKYRDLTVVSRWIICLSLRLWQKIHLLATEKSRYFSQPRPMIVKYLWRWDLSNFKLKARGCSYFTQHKKLNGKFNFRQLLWKGIYYGSRDVVHV